MRAAIALTKDAPPLTEAERLERIQRWTKSAAANRHGESRDLVSDLRKIKTTLDPKDHLTSRIVVNEFEKFIANKQSASSDRKVQFLSARGQTKTPVEVPENLGQYQNFQKILIQNLEVPTRPRTSVDVSGQSKQYATVKYSKPSTPGPKNKKNDNNNRVMDESKIDDQIGNQQDPSWWHRKIRQGYLETEEMISKIVDQRKIEEKHWGVKPLPYTRKPDFMSRKFTHNGNNPHTSNERRRLDRSMERLRKKHEACFGKPITPSEMDSTSGAGAPAQSKKRKGAICRVSGLHVPVPSHLVTRDPIPLPKTMTGHLEDNWSAPKYPRTASKTKKAMEEPPPNPKPKNDIKVLYERQKNAKEFVSPERANPNSKSNTVRREWVERLYDAKAKKVVRDAENEKKRSQQEKDNMNALYKELLMNKRRLTRNEDGHKDWRGKRVPSWRVKQFLGGGGSNGSKTGSSDYGSSAQKKEKKKGALSLLSKDKWNERPPKGLGMWLEGVIAKAKRQQELAQGIPPVTQAFMRPLPSYHI